MPSQRCPTCKGSYRDLLEHIRKKHPAETYTDRQLQPLGLVSCPYCGTACRGSHGIKTHSAKIHGIEGQAHISTLPRPRTYIATRATSASRASLASSISPTRPNQASPGLVSYRGLIGRKRPARTPSPQLQRPTRRQRQLQPSPTLERPSSEEPTLEEPTLDRPSSRESYRSFSSYEERGRPSSPRSSSPAPSSPAPSSPRPSSQGPTLEPLEESTLEPLEPPEEPTLEPKEPIEPEEPMEPKEPIEPEEPMEPEEPTLEESLQSLEQPPKAARPSIAPSPAQKAARLLERGYLGRAARALIDPTPIAPNSTENRARLLEKHPIGSKDPFQGKTRPRAGQLITSEIIIAAIASIGKEKAPGLSG
ncbi:uncharacterized protein NECHADRAFT_88811 [Fusarium vanettenii 77-13-4]|uniref:C2H2-type domain-containing protein n=1 Tax=Fusarium vanettenii (strain ATCC MYA-4622 / CBS 123669 / FGSC 9596 / NRRL 45880 / 77-13-4) TaxID=660122 RepID=C7ZQ07_FUSV7|nr:uncharacterized protein NECHADRAFT_88811 [Fusarium vanettenii 77-13-4]EEU33888.1 hypothetical protein NECHADRAFT_88811 [Fusarium vanettenii 77-13-4]